VANGTVQVDWTFAADVLEKRMGAPSLALEIWDK
jgi:hypothetical protein